VSKAGRVWLTTPERLQDALALSGAGNCPREVSRRMGVDVGALAALLYRHGHVAAARPFWREERTQRRARLREARNGNRPAASG
jgi:hypothetical protein